MKLYWRYKKDGKWTWVAAEAAEFGDAGGALIVEPMEEEE